MKLVLAALLLTGTALADQSWWDRAGQRRERREAMRDVRQSRVDAMRARAEARRDTARQAREAHREALRARMEARQDMARERRDALREARAARADARREAREARFSRWRRL